MGKEQITIRLLSELKEQLQRQADYGSMVLFHLIKIMYQQNFLGGWFSAYFF